VPAGSAVALGFSLDGAPRPASNSGLGLNVFATGFPQASTVACPTTAPHDIATTTAAPGLVYDVATDQYFYTWRSNATTFPRGSCALIRFGFNDGPSGTVNTRREVKLIFK
jgi:hypothetical protein